MARQNVRQHVVPRFYLANFADRLGRVHALDIETGAKFAADPINLCVERDAFSLLHEGERDDSCDRINNRIEDALSPLLGRLGPGTDLTTPDMQREVFTLLAAFTANLIARSRVFRSEFDNNLDRINGLLAEHPDLLDEFPEDKYQDFLRDPAAYPEIIRRIPAFLQLAPLLREQNERSLGPATVEEAVESLKQLKLFHYAVFLKPRTCILSDVMIEAGVGADLLVAETARFITCDDPVIFILDGNRATKVSPASLRVWSSPGRSVFLPLKPTMAIHWVEGGKFTSRTAGTTEVHRFNALVRDNAIRHLFAADPADLES